MIFSQIKNFVSIHRWAGFLCLLLLNALYVTILCSVLPIRFEDNDDITSAWICSGIYSGTPDGHLVFINALYGYVVAELYKLIPDLEWYTMLYIIWHILSFTVILDFAHRVLQSKCLKYIVYLLLYVAFSMVIVRLQFTTVASVMAFAGILLLCERKWLSGGLLLILGSLIRFESAGMVGLLMSPMIIYNYRLDIKRAYLPIAAVLTIVLSLHIADTFFYQSTDWKNFMECSKYLTRGKIEDNPNIWKIYDSLPDGISKNNYCLTVGFCHDPGAVSAEQLKAISDKLTSLPVSVKIFNLVKPVKNNWLCFFFLALMSLSIFLVAEKKNKIVLFVTLFLFLFVTIVLCMNATLKFRVLFSAVLSISYALILIGDQCINKKSWLYMPIVAAICVFAFNMLKAEISQIQNANQGVSIMKEQLALYSEREGYTIVTDGPDFRVEQFDAFQLRHAIEPRSFVNPYCFAGSPLTPNYMSHKDFVDKQICLFSNKLNGYEERFKSLKDNYNLDADTIHIASTEQYALVKFVLKDHE